MLYRVLLVLALLLPSFTQAQTSQPSSSFFIPSADTYSPVDLEVTGDETLSRKELLDLAPWILEGELTPNKARRFLKEIYATGKVRDAALFARHGSAGDILIVELKSRLYIAEIAFTGIEDIDEEKVRRAFGVRRGDEFIEDRAARQGELLRVALYELGYRSAQVAVFEGKTSAGVSLSVSVELGEPTRVSALYLDGSPPEVTREVQKVLSLREGAIIDLTQKKEDFRKLKLAIRTLGYYDAQIEGPAEEKSEEGASLRYKIKLGPRYEVGISGLSALSRAEAMKVLQLENEGIIVSSTLGAASQRLEDALHEKGFANAEVSGKVAVKVDNYRLIRFEVNEGEEISLSGVRFPGASVFSEKDLYQTVKARLVAGITPAEDPPTGGLDERGTVSGRKSPYSSFASPARPLRPEEIYRQKAIRQAISDIKKRYLALGYEAVQVGPEELVWSPSGTEVEVKIPILEGPQTTVSSIKVEGNQAFSTKELTSLGPLAVNGPYTQDAQEDLRVRIVEQYTKQGYLYAQIDAIPTRESASKVSVALVIQEGPQVTYAGVKIEGNQEVQRDAIEDYVRFTKGEVLTPQKMRALQSRLLSLGLFESVSIEPEKKNTPEAQKILIVSVRERKSRVFEWSIGASSDDGPRGQILYTDGDVFGQMLAFSLRAKLSDSQVIAARQEEVNAEDFFKNELERKLVASLRDPLLGEALGSLVAGEVLFVHQRINRAAFGVTKTSFGFALGTVAEQKRGFSFSLEADLENNVANGVAGQDLDAIRAGLPQSEQDLLDVFEGQTILASLRPGLSYDLRNNPFNPTKGIFLRADLEAARSLTATGRDLNFVSLGRLSTTAAAYVPYRRVVFEWVFRGGMVLPFSPESRTPPDRLFFVGGTGSVRGFQEDGLLPQDFADSLSDALAVRQEESHGRPQGEFLTPLAVPRSLGGNSFVALSSAVRFPLQKSKKAEGELFLDVGNAWLAPVSFDPFVLRASVGAGVRFPTVIGPVRLEAALKLNQRADLLESIGQIHFAVGAF